MSDSYVQIANLLSLYAELCDTGDFEGLGQMFAHAELSSAKRGTVQRGHDEVVDYYTSIIRLFPDGTAHTKHVTTNFIIDVNETAGTATSTSYFSVLQEIPDKGIEVIVAGHYEDEFERVDGTWRFTRRLKVRHLSGDLSHHNLK